MSPCSRSLRTCALIIMLLLCLTVHAQRVAITTDGSPPDSSAMLDIQSADAGLLIPRMSGDQRAAIHNPATGLLVFQTDSAEGFWYHHAGQWIHLDAVKPVIADTDADTRVQVEESEDEDLIRFDIGGAEYFRMDMGRIEVLNNGESVFIGEGAGMHDDQDDNVNVFIGFQSGQSNVLGTANIGIGHQSLQNNLSFWNSGLGYGALKSNTTALGNTAVGFQAMNLNTEGQFNAGLGYRVMENNTTGNQNVAIGTKALFSNTVGSYLVAIGDSSMYRNGLGAGNAIDGSGNTAVGSKSLFANEIGYHNTTLGFQSGRLTTGSGNVFLGYQAGYAETGDNKLYIENSDSAAPLIFGEFEKDSVSINGTLNVEGTIRVQSSVTEYPPSGTIRWNDASQDFEGYTGTEWRSLTFQGSSWGELANTENEALSGTGIDRHFGVDVFVSGNDLMVGERPTNGGLTGRVYFYQTGPGSGWTSLGSGSPSDAPVNSFGSSVAADSGRAIIGAPYYDGVANNQGKVYFFHKSGGVWSEVDSMTASDAAIDDQLGYDVAISGDYALAGAPNHDTYGDPNRGKAYIYHWTGTEWMEDDSLIASDGAAGDLFGRGVALWGDYAIVGAPFHNTYGDMNRGKAYIFHRSGSTWTEQDSLVADDGSADDHFGNSVGITDGHAIVGAPQHDGSYEGQGKAYAFRREGIQWSQVDSLVAPDAGEDDRFGDDVSVSGDYAVVGAYGHSTYGNSFQGKVYVFHMSGSRWMFDSALIASDGASSDSFGESVSIDGGHIVVGAKAHDANGIDNSGKVYLFYMQ